MIRTTLQQILFSLTALFLLSIHFAASAQQFNYEQIAATPYLNTIDRIGTLAFKNTTSLSFKSNGYLLELAVEEGDFFNKGQLLASLDTKEMIAHKNSTYAQLLQAKRELERIEQLLTQNLSSKQALELAKTNVEISRSAYQVANYHFEKAQLIAPFDGVVLSRNTDLGELQLPGKSALTIAALDNNWVVRVALTGSEINQVRLGQQVQVNLHHVGRLKGVVNRIPAMATQGNGLFTIDVLLPDLVIKSGIVAGQLAEVVIDFSDDNLVYRVPIHALLSVNAAGQAIVLVKEEQTGAPRQQVFDIYKMTNHYLFLFANTAAMPIEVLTKGWQQLAVEP